MSGTSTFFRRKRRLKSEINTPVSTPSKIIVCECESLMREHDKILSIRVSTLPNSFLLMSLFIESIWYVGGCSVFYFESLCNNAIYRLSAATNQSTNDQREQTLHLDTSQLALNQDPTVC